MAAKLRMQNRKMVARAIPLMEKMPVATINSTKVMPRLFAAAGLINIILDPVLGHVGAQRTGVSQAAEIGPSDAHIELADAGRIGRCRASECREANRHRPVIGSALGTAGRGGVIRGGERRRNETRIGHLRPVIKTDGLKLLQQDLGGALIFAGDAHDAQAVIDGTDDAGAGNRNDTSGDHHLDQSHATGEFFGKTYSHSRLEEFPGGAKSQSLYNPVFIQAILTTTLSLPRVWFRRDSESKWLAKEVNAPVAGVFTGQKETE